MYLLQTQLDLAAAARHVALRGFSHSASRDEALTIKTVLTEALGGAAMRPWRVEARAGHTIVVTAYAELEPEMVEHRRQLALPSLQMAVQGILGCRMPKIAADELLRFVVRLCPTVRVTASKAGCRRGERDAYLYAVDLADGALERSREEVYLEYLRSRLTGTEITQARLAGFRIVRAVRKADTAGWGIKALPVAEIEGHLRVVDPAALRSVMRAGVGRQRAFGCGMVRIEPAQAKQVAA